MKIIAFYLPQFHEIPENNKWWGNGFTEWVNVKNAKPLFPGHEQPKLPLNNNYYDLLDDSVKEWQIRLAKEAGIYGFCFYHYWFHGKLMLEKPLEQYLNNDKLNFPFCLCWANPPWTKIWAGEGSSVLIDQNYSDEDDWEAHFEYMLPFFRDNRYICEDGKPFVVLYDPNNIKNIDQLIAFLRRRMSEEGFPGIKIAYQYYTEKNVTRNLLKIFDYRIEFEPIYGLNKMERVKQPIKKVIDIIQKKTGLRITDKISKIRITDYDALWNTIINMKPSDGKTIPGAFVNWDNTPRRGTAGRVVIGGSPEKFKNYMIEQIRRAEEIYKSDYLFITAWNEWSEGSYLEPDSNNDYGYLNAIKLALQKSK